MSRPGKKMTPEAAGTAPRADVVPNRKKTMAHKPKSKAQANAREGAITEQVLFVCQKGAGKQLMVRIARFKGHRYCDARLWLTSTEGLEPTTKGVTLPLQELRAIGAALIAWNDDEGSYGPSDAA